MAGGPRLGWLRRSLIRAAASMPRIAHRSERRIVELAVTYRRAANEGAVEASARGANGQESCAATVVSPCEAASCDDSPPIAQWCLPLRRQQAGKRDASTLADHPDASATAGTAGPKPRTSNSKMERILRIRFYPTPAVFRGGPAQVSSKKRESPNDSRPKLLENEPQKRKFPCPKALPPSLLHSRFRLPRDRSA